MFIEVYKDVKKQWRWRMKAGNGRVLADGLRGRRLQSQCKDAARRVEYELSDESKNIELFQDKAGEWRWRLRIGREFLAESSESYVKKSNVKRILGKIVRGIGTRSDLLEMKVIE